MDRSRSDKITAHGIEQGRQTEAEVLDSLGATNPTILTKRSEKLAENGFNGNLTLAVHGFFLYPPSTCTQNLFLPLEATLSSACLANSSFDVFFFEF